MLSIIIPTWNEENYLPKLLECLKRQTYRDFEVIVADAHSTDKTRSIAKKYGCRIIKNGGLPGIGRNNGAKAAKEDMLLFLDADVTISRDFLEKALKEIKERRLKVTGCYLIPDSNNLADIFGHKVLNIWFFLMQYIYPHMAGQCIFSAMDIHKKLKGFDETILFAEDMDYVNRSRKHCRFGILKSVKILSSTRRFKKENHYILGLKYFLCPFYRMLFGEIRTNIFNYRFDYDKKR